MLTHFNVLTDFTTSPIRMKISVISLLGKKPKFHIYTITYVKKKK
jgi:hypothetical protein